jgi:hypothetical protein
VNPMHLVWRPVFILVAVVAVAHGESGAKPTWAKKATAFESECREKKDWPRCKPLHIPSPDGQSSVEVLYQQPFKDDAEIGDVKVAYLRVTLPDGHTRGASLPDGFQPVDLLWSPDSKAFFVNGGNGGGYWGFWVYVFRLDDPELEAINVTQEAQKDMVRLFPPCKAKFLDRETCQAIEREPDNNMSGIDWVADSSAIVVMAEVPCSGGHGGIMCQVQGYELEVPTWRIRKRMAAREFKRQWQPSMAWKFEIPDPPEYEPKK